jgi:hypothetical protein
MSQLLDHLDHAKGYHHRPQPGFVVISSPYRGYTDTGEYTDIARNIEVARDIYVDYWDDGQPAICLVDLLTSILGEVAADEEEIHEQALRWCLTFVRKADEVHFWYPRGMYLTRGMRLEFEEACRLGKPKEIEREW